jgi:hypothetical protein
MCPSPSKSPRIKDLEVQRAPDVCLIFGAYGVDGLLDEIVGTIKNTAPGYSFIKATSFDEASKTLPQATRALLYFHASWEPRHAETAKQLGELGDVESFRKLVEAVEARAIPWILLDYHGGLIDPIFEKAAGKLVISYLEKGAPTCNLECFFGQEFKFGQKTIPWYY